jgi:hypothetical protein
MPPPHSTTRAGIQSSYRARFELGIGSNIYYNKKKPLLASLYKTAVVKRGIRRYTYTSFPL